VGKTKHEIADISTLDETDDNVTGRGDSTIRNVLYIWNAPVIDHTIKYCRADPREEYSRGGEHHLRRYVLRG